MRYLDGNGNGEVIYDFKYDILTFKINGRIYKKSVKLQNFVADVDKEGFVTGVRIFDASKVFQVDKLVFTKISDWNFTSQIQDNVVSIALRFVGSMPNKLIPLLSQRQSFSQYITSPLGKNHLADCKVECLS